jgi:hypothetical protein
MLQATLLSLTLLSDTIPLEIRQGRPIVDGVYVNGHGPYRFLLDTGEEKNQMGDRLAQNLQVQTTLYINLLTAAGVVKASGARGLTIRVGPMEADQQDVLFTRLDALHQWSADVQGILGEAFLSRFDYLLDVSHRRLEFGKRHHEGLRVPFQILAGVPAVSTNQGMLALDSGADQVVLFGRQGPGSRQVRKLRTEAGFVTAVIDKNRPLVLGGRAIHYPGALVMKQPPRVAQNGVLPVSLFRTVYVCNSERYLVLTQ